ncbi:antA/AntB antirepressor family protein, partial [Clostridioides mangenotii]|uniref:antA/AntB antirepressor family protein n=1 Tax=Metaclostridioides mangenotii TaxID=1540 RepID=UPI00214A2803
MQFIHFLRFRLWFDFTLLSQKCETNNPKNPITEIQDHAIKLDMAKEIAMI